ncbi:hypothetical protein PC113_g16970, partial [Phytophthora cactorum]
LSGVGAVDQARGEAQTPVRELRAEQSTSKRKYEPGNDGLRYIESFLMNML